MSAILNDPFPHAANVNIGSLPAAISPSARALLLSNFAAAAASITVQTVGGETVTIALGTTTVASAPVILPLQVQAITAIANIGTVTALWH